jgi:hypothetical protein
MVNHDPCRLGRFFNGEVPPLDLLGHAHASPLSVTLTK